MQRPARRSGFTLMELLIVIAIIGIISGMMFPVVNYVREKARKTECMNNLRQWGAALQGYLDEHRGKFPSYAPKLEATDAWFNVLPAYLADNIDPMSVQGAAGRIAVPGAGIKTPFLCTSESVGLSGDDAKPGSTYYSSYTMNSWIDNAQNESKGFTKRLRITQLHEQHDPPVTPASFVVFAETADGTKGGVDLGSDALNEKACRHSRSMNLCFADGHAENVHFNHLGCGLGSDKNYGGIQWNPTNPDLTGGASESSGN